MKKVFWAIFAAAIFASCVNGGSGNGIENYVNVGDEVPSFTLTHADGSGTVEFPSGFQDSPAVIVLFQSSCRDCQREMPKIHAAWKATAAVDPQKVSFIAVSRGEPAQTVGDYWTLVTDMKPSFSPMPYYLDPDKSVFDMFANSRVPRIYLVGSDGKVKYMAIERFDFDTDKLIKMINELQ